MNHYAITGGFGRRGYGDARPYVGDEYDTLIVLEAASAIEARAEFVERLLGDSAFQYATTPPIYIRTMVVSATPIRTLLDRGAEPMHAGGPPPEKE